MGRSFRSPWTRWRARIAPPCRAEAGRINEKPRPSDPSLGWGYLSLDRLPDMRRRPCRSRTTRFPPPHTADRGGCQAPARYTHGFSRCATVGPWAGRFLLANFRLGDEDSARAEARQAASGATTGHGLRTRGVTGGGAGRMSRRGTITPARVPGGPPCTPPPTPRSSSPTSTPAASAAPRTARPADADLPGMRRAPGHGPLGRQRPARGQGGLRPAPLRRGRDLPATGRPMDRSGAPPAVPHPIEVRVQIANPGRAAGRCMTPTATPTPEGVPGRTTVRRVIRRACPSIGSTPAGRPARERTRRWVP